MHIPSKRVYNEMRSEEFSLWCVPANGGDEIAFLIKTPTSSIKALVSGCPMELVFGIKEHYLCIGVQIEDMPDTPVFICKLQKHSEEHDALMRALEQRFFPLFLYNEMDVCLAWTNIKMSEQNAKAVKDFLGQVKNFYTGPYVNETSHVLDCFTYSVDKRNTYSNVQIISTCKIDTNLEKWRILQNYFYSAHESHSITIEIIVPYMIRLRFRDFVKECKNLLIYRLSHTEGCAKVLFFCPLFSTDYFERVQLSVHDGNFAHPYNDEAVP